LKSVQVEFSFGMAVIHLMKRLYPWCLVVQVHDFSRFEPPDWFPLSIRNGLNYSLVRARTWWNFFISLVGLYYIFDTTGSIYLLILQCSFSHIQISLWFVVTKHNYMRQGDDDGKYTTRHLTLQTFDRANATVFSRYVDQTSGRPSYLNRKTRDPVQRQQSSQVVQIVAFLSSARHYRHSPLVQPM
jgi:hypothetical protein